MKGFITSIGIVLLFIILWPEHPILALTVPLPLGVLVIMFWTGAVGIRIDKD